MDTNRSLLPALAFFPLLALVAGACGGGDGGSGPPTAPLSEDIVPSIFGTCRKLCCADRDCTSGDTCVPFDAGWGTLGTCTGEAASALGGGEAWPSSDGNALPAGCWTKNPAYCNPISNSGCDAGSVCDFDPGDEDLEPTVGCYLGPSIVAPGERCDSTYGEYCVGGHHCLPDD